MRNMPARLQRSLAIPLVVLMTFGVTLTAATMPSATAQDSCAPWCSLAVFDDYVNGSLRSQGPWHVNTPGATDGALAADDVPSVFSGKTMVNAVDTTDETIQYRGNAYAELGPLGIADGNTGTLFLEFATDDVATTGLNLGLSADPSPGLGFDTTGDPLDLDDYAVQFTIDARGLVVRDGDQDRVVDNVAIESDTRYRFWVTVDNGADTFALHAATGRDQAVRVASGGTDEFSFRTPSPEPLVTYLHLNDPVDLPSSASYIDNIYVAPTTDTLDDPSPRFEEVLTFSGYSTGSVAGQDGWSGSTEAEVTADPVDGMNKVLGMHGPNLIAHRAVPGVDDGATGTVFFRMRRAGNVDTSIGLSDVDSPTTFGDFEAQANNQNSSTLNVRNGAGFTPVGSWSPATWQCIWIVADNANDQVRMYSRGGPYRVTTRLPVDEELAYAFRNGTTEALDRFFAINGRVSPSGLFIDDVSVDTNAVNLRVPGGDEQSCPATASDDLPLADPIPETPTSSPVALTVEELTTIPASGGGSGARINHVSEIPDGSGRLVVPDLNGRMWVLVDGEPVEFLNAATEFDDFVSSPSLGTGLGFVAFHPNFAQNKQFYTVHTEAGDALTTRTPDLPSPEGTSVHGVITEWTMDDPGSNEFSGTRREVLRIGFDTFLHGLQKIGFNPTAEPGEADYGNLYIALGDGEQVPQWTDGPQNLGVPHGKILRIDPSRTDGAGGGYGVPSDNPFVGQSGALGEIYAYGLRNPHRFSWDPSTGRMFVGMIGESNIDAIYEVKPGDNYGWNVREGAFLFKKSDPTNVYPLPEDDEQYGFTYPVAAYDHDTGRAIVAGFAYRGDAAPALRGKFVFGDIVTGGIYFTELAQMRRGEPRAPIFEPRLLDVDGNPVTMRELAGNSRVDLRFGIDADGEMYLLSKTNGKIWRITDATLPASCTVGEDVVTDVMAASDWAPVTPEKWEFPGSEIALIEPGDPSSGPRRPFEYAVLTEGPEFGAVQIDAEVRLDTPVSVSNRDVVVIFGYKSPTEFYYAHLSQDNTSYAHNGIFVVDNADRLRIDDQWNGAVGAPPAITDGDYHKIRVRHCADSGEIAVYVDGASTPLMTATDQTFSSGRVGFGSFDNIGRMRNLTVTGDALQRNPVVEQVEDMRTRPGRPVVVDVEATDPDGDQLTYSLTEAPDRATIDEETGVVSWRAGRPGEASFTVSVTDGELRDATSFVVTVQPRP